MEQGIMEAYDDLQTIYSDDNIYLGKDENSRYYLTFIHNQTMLRFDYPQWVKIIGSLRKVRL